MANEITTYGYAQHIADPDGGIAYMDALMDDPLRLLIDIRLVPYANSKFPMWHGVNLAKRYGCNAIGKTRYIHGSALGNLNYKPEDRDKGFELKAKRIGLDKLKSFLAAGYHPVLLCGCRDYTYCHRGLVAQLLMAEVPELKVEHMGKPVAAASTMKALSIQEPWTRFIAEGFKPVENREWSTNYRGPVLLHAGSKVDSQWFEDGELSYRMMSHYGILDYGLPESKASYATGAIIGVANLVDVVTEMDNRWFCGTYGFVFEGARVFKQPIPYKGQLSLFNVPASVVADALKQIELPEIERHTPIVKPERMVNLILIDGPIDQPELFTTPVPYKHFDR